MSERIAELPLASDGIQSVGIQCEDEYVAVTNTCEDLVPPCLPVAEFLIEPGSISDTPDITSQIYGDILARTSLTKTFGMVRDERRLTC